MEVKVRNIADRSREIFLKYGIRSVSMDDISRELGMSKKTLYQHFLNKSDLIRQVLEVSMEEFCNRILAIVTDGYNAIDDLLETSLVIDGHMKEVNMGVTFDLQKYYPILYREYFERKRSMVSEYLARNIEKGIRENLYRNDLNLELIAKLYFQKIEDLHDPNFYDKDKIPFGEVFRVMLESHIRGIANENGIRYLEERLKTYKLEIR